MTILSFLGLLQQISTKLVAIKIEGKKEMYSHTFLEVKSLKSGGRQGHAPSQVSGWGGGDLYSFWMAPGVSQLVVNSILTPSS